MTDRDVSVGCVVAHLLWSAVLVMLAMTWWSGNWELGVTTLVLSVAAATVTIRCFLVAQSESMHEVFDLGRNSVSRLK